MTLDVVEVDEFGVWMTRGAFVFGGAWVRHAAVVVGAVDGGVGGAVEGVGGVDLEEWVSGGGHSCEQDANDAVYARRHRSPLCSVVLVQLWNKVGGMVGWQ